MVGTDAWAPGLHDGDQPQCFVSRSATVSASQSCTLQQYPRTDAESTKPLATRLWLKAESRSACTLDAEERTLARAEADRRLKDEKELVWEVYKSQWDMQSRGDLFYAKERGLKLGEEFERRFTWMVAPNISVTVKALQEAREGQWKKREDLFSQTPATGQAECDVPSPGCHWCLSKVEPSTVVAQLSADAPPLCTDLLRGNSLPLRLQSGQHESPHSAREVHQGFSRCVPLCEEASHKLVCENSGLWTNSIMICSLWHVLAVLLLSGKERLPGVSSTHAVIHIVEKTAEKSDMANIIINARVAALNMIGGACAECIYV